jgi:hypothetical protein
MKTITAFLKNVLMLQPKNNLEISNIIPSISCYDVNLSVSKKFYNISYVHNRDVVPSFAIKQAKKVRKTII